MRKHIRITDEYHGEHFSILRDGKRWFTPLFMVMVMIGVTDVIFAVDSIPAIFAITLDPFIVLTSNVFAILGLRAMYFLLANMHEKFHLLSYGLALILGFIGTKMLIMGVYKIPVGWSLGVTAAILVTTMVLSLLMPARAEPTRPGTSSLAGAPSARLVTGPRKPEDGEAG
jgi:tellurite resistance protein TerC